jgi:ParB family chromosome partitioning protein
MAKKRPRVSLAQAIKPRSGDLRKLFSTEEDAEQASGMQLLAVRLDAIVPDPDQPRRTFPEDSLQELSDSIQQDGVIQPIEVTELDADHYMIVHGERRWKAAQLAGLETIPAVIRRYDYDTITRLVRQLVENIQREDLNDVDRAAGLLRMREFLQAELDVMIREGTLPDDSSPWSKTITWAKVGKRLGMSRQRIHQLIRLLDLPEAIKEDVRTGKLSERETRVYQGLRPRQQRDLHRARYEQELSANELRLVVYQLKSEPAMTVAQAIHEVRRPLPDSMDEPEFETSFAPGAGQTTPGLEATSHTPLRSQPWSEGSILPARQSRPTSVDRLDWVRGHLARIQRQDLSPAERREIVRLLQLIQQDVASLLSALGEDDGGEMSA